MPIDQKIVVSENELIKYLSDKTIAVVGNAPATSNHGSVIDRHDTIIRINNFSIQKQQRGIKTNVWCHCYESNVAARSQQFDFCWCPNPKLNRAPLCQAPTVLFNNQFFRSIPISRPSTGIYILNWLYNHGFQYDYYHFDGFTTRQETWHNSADEIAELTRLDENRIVEAIIPYRDEPSRRKAFTFVVELATQQFSKVHVECVNRSSILNKSQLLNKGLEKVNSKSLVAFIDADMFTDNDSLRNTVAIARRHNGITYPFTSYIKLGKQATQQFIRTKSLKGCQNDMVRVSWAPGGYMLMPAAIAKEIRFDEQFVEWGGEDDAFRKAVRLFTGCADKRLKGTCYHLWHRNNQIRHLQNAEAIHKYSLIDLPKFLSAISQEKIEYTEQTQLQLYKDLHRHPKIYPGDSLEKELPYISRLVAKYKCKTALDFGCGKGCQYTRQQLHKRMGLVDISLYDPAVPEFAVLPDNKFDIIISTDVLEHIPLTTLPIVLDRIFSRATKVVYLAISTARAATTLLNGENAHCTVRDPKWWIEFVRHYMPAGVRVMLRFNPKFSYKILYENLDNCSNA